MDQGRVNKPVAYGLSDLHIAVISGQTCHVRKILRDNDKEIINAGDVDGTTPLMTAVLTGRRTIARLLLQNGASAQTRDRRGRKALVYSRASLFKTKLRLYRSLGLLPPVSHKQHRNRGLIAKVLRYPAALESCRRGGNHECSRAIFFKDGETLKVLRPEMKFKIAKESLKRATAGFITSNTRPEVKIAATSGWQPNPSKGPNVLDNPRYLQLVQDFAQAINFKLIRSQRDNNGIHMPEHSGRFVASHTEKKLAVFWVIAALQAILNTTDFRRVHELREADIPVPWKQAWIFLDHTPCGNCWQFLRAIKRVTGIRICLETRPFLLRGNREAAAGCHNCPCDRCRRKFEAQPVRDDKVGTEGRGDGTDEETGTSEGEVPEFELEAGPDFGFGDGPDGPTLPKRDGDGQLRPCVKSAGFRALPAPSKPPQAWRQYGSDDAGRPIAKPVCRPLAHFPTPPPLASNSIQNGERVHERQTTPACAPQATPCSNTPELRDPVSTMAGRSGFFVTPDLPPRSIEVRIPKMSPRVRAEYDRLSDISGARSASRRSGTLGSVSERSKGVRKSQRRTVQQALSTLNLGQYRYNGRGPSTAAASATRDRTGRGRESKTKVHGGRVAKVAGTSTGKKPRTRVGRDEKVRARGAFARAVEHHQRRRAGNT